MDLPLFLKELAVPVRKPKLSEVNTISRQVRDGHSMASGMTFYGTPDPLTVQVSGWLRTPYVNNRFDLSVYGLSVLDVSTPELILMYIEGAMQRNPKGTGIRVDPSSYTDPYGNVYYSPTIMSFEASFTPNPKKQMFSMQLWLEN